jgi:ferredoxin
MLVICSPVHVSGLPKFIEDHLRKTAFSGVDQAYGVFTNAGYCGVAGSRLRSVLRKKGIALKGFADITMPGIHITSITNRQIDVDEIERRIGVASERMPSIAQAMQRGEVLDGKFAGAPEVALTVSLAPLLRFIGLRTRLFHADDRCISCGLCERICPVSTIAMRDSRPVWTDSHCAHCMACIHNCPKGAIEYGDVTQEKRRYTFAKYRYAARR